MIYSTYDTHLRGTVRFTVIEMEVNWKNMQLSMQMQTNNRSSCSQVMERLFCRFGISPGKQQRWSSTLLHYRPFNFIKAGLHHGSLRGNLRQNRYFLCSTSRQLLLIVETIFIVPSPSFLPYLYKWTRGRERLTSSGLSVGSPPG